MFFFNKACGVAAVQPKIVGGTNVNAYSWPWQALLTITGTDGTVKSCGGSLITNEWIGTFKTTQLLLYNKKLF